MNKVIEYLDKWKDGAEALRKIGTPSEWEIQRIQECVNGLFTFAKFKVGDTVKMSNTYPVNRTDSPGWMSYRHLMEKGSRSLIRGVDYYEGSFRYSIEFIEKSWIDDKDVIHKSDMGDSSIFTMKEKWLAKGKK